MPDIITHPGYGAFFGHDDTCSDAGVNPKQGCRLKSGHVCKECGGQFLAYERPEKCVDHVGEEPI